jgi:hypothetical protein
MLQVYFHNLSFFNIENLTNNYRGKGGSSAAAGSYEVYPDETYNPSSHIMDSPTNCRNKKTLTVKKKRRRTNVEWDKRSAKKRRILKRNVERTKR